jgi:hypothetical protein
MFTNIHRRTIILGTVAALAVGIIGGFAITEGRGGRGHYPVTLGDPESRRSGELNPAAVNAAESFTHLPVLWLGTEFQGLALTHADESKILIPGAGAGRSDIKGVALVLIYGTCEVTGTPGASEAPSCVPPVQLRMSSPGTVPSPEEVPAAATTSDIYSARGLEVRDVSLGTTLWLESGVTVTIHSDSDIRDEVMAALRTANGKAMGYNDVDAGKSLATLNPVALPPPVE